MNLVTASRQGFADLMCIVAYAADIGRILTGYEMPYQIVLALSYYNGSRSQIRQ